MVKVLGMFDTGSMPKMDFVYMETVLNQIQSKVADAAQPLVIFIICTHSKRWREGKWKNKHGLNFAIRLPREAVDAMSREEVSAQAVELAKKALGWDQKPVA